jgi:hypothetical protein
MKHLLTFTFIITLASGLLAGCAGLQTTPTSTFTPIPLLATDGGLTVTQADNGKTIEMKVGDTFLLNLGYDYNWNITISDESVLSRVKNIMVINGAQGVYQALKAGTTTMSISGDPVCRASTPPCMAPSLMIQVTVVVK